MSLALSFHYLMLNMLRMLIHPSSGACDLFVELIHGLYCSGSMCVGVTLWFGCGGMVSVCRLQPAYGCWCYFVVWLGWCGICTQAEAIVLQPACGYHTTPAKPQRNTNTSNQSNTTHEITQQISRKLLRMDVLASETC